MSNLAYIVQYFDSKKLRMAEADVDDIELNTNEKSCKLLQTNEGQISSLTVHIIHTPDYNLFAEAVDETKQLVNISLQINSTIRDIYFSGLYNTVDIDADFVFNEILHSAIQGRVIDQNELLRPKPRNASVIASPAKSGKQLIEIAKTNIECIYCDIQRSNAPETSFAVHPYVPCSYGLIQLFLCMTCVENWREYREKAIRDDLLILDGELNEEICSVCSNMPEELVLCSMCPRSFCKPCLRKLVPEQQCTQILNDMEGDWLCMACSCELTSIPNMTKNSWKIIAGLQVQPEKPSSAPPVHETVTPKKIRVTENSTAPSSMDSTQSSSQVLSLLVQAAASLGQEDWTYHEIKTLGTILDERGWDCGSAISRDPRIIQELKHKKSLHAVLTHKKELHPLWMKLKEITTKSLSSAKLGPSQGKRKLGETGISISIQPKDSTPAVIEHKKAAPASTARRDMTKPIIPDVPTRLTAPSSGKSVAKSTEIASTAQKPKKRVRINSSAKPTKVNEMFYFAQYIQYYDSMCRAIAGTGKKRSQTEDSCFLCKDGGDLIECDHVNGSKCRCKKVYHEYCLSYIVPEYYKKWVCPRHFCDNCGNEDLQYYCLYCPVSICKECPPGMATKFGISRYFECPLPVTEEIEDTKTAIVCQFCEEAIRLCKQFQELPESFTPVYGAECKFPGVTDDMDIPVPIANSLFVTEPTQLHQVKSRLDNVIAVNPNSKISQELMALAVSPSRFGRQRQATSRFM